MELLDFYAEWCGPCQMMKPTIDEFIEAHPEAKVRRINIDDSRSLAEEYRVSTIPCLVVVRDGKEVAREVGVAPLKRIEKIWEKANG